VLTLVLAALATATSPALLVVPLDGRPVRLGVPLPASAVATGLRLEGRGTLQWRRLPIGAPDADPVWVELAIVGPPGTVRVCPGGDGPCADGNGPACVREEQLRDLPHGSEHVVRWRWRDGTLDERTRTTFTVATTIGDETFAVGEALTVQTPGCDERAAVLCRLPRGYFATIGLLPERRGGGATTETLRAHVQRLLPRLQELPGVRGAGDYGRSGGVVTNLEYDTTLALLRAALALGDVPALQRAQRAARHLRDRDLDVVTGLAFPHGPGHRGGRADPGHTWLRGLLHVGLLTADDGHLQAARNLAHAIVASPPLGSGEAERLRDYAWPLAELEALLEVAPEPPLARAADRYARSIARRFDAVANTWRFGEGEVGGGVYFERGWLTAGILLPALRAHLARRTDPQLADQVAAATAALLARIGSNGQGLPTHWRLARGVVFAEHREEGTAEAACLLDALPVNDLQRLLRRSTVRAAVREFPSPDDPDLPTQWSLLARCDWLWR